MFTAGGSTPTISRVIINLNNRGNKVKEGQERTQEKEEERQGQRQRQGQRETGRTRNVERKRTQRATIKRAERKRTG